MLTEEIEKKILSKLEVIEESLRINIQTECELLAGIHEVYYLSFLKNKPEVEK